METVKLRFARLLAVALPATGVALAAGAYPTWRLAGWAGVSAAAVATGVVLGVLLGVGAMVAAVGRSRGASAAGKAFVGSAVLRFAASLGLALGAWAWLGVSVFPLLIWVAGLYIVLLLVETRWIACWLARVNQPKEPAA